MEHYHQITYDLGCIKCKNSRSGTTIIRSDNPNLHMTQTEMIDEMDNFENIDCENCGSKGNWDLLKIEFNGKNVVIDKFPFHAVKKNNEMAIRNIPTSFGRDKLMGIKAVMTDEINKFIKYGNCVSLPNGELQIYVDILSEEPFFRPDKNKCRFNGFSENEMTGLIEFYFDKMCK